MVLEKNPKTRPIARKLLVMEDKLKGAAFPQMKRVKQSTIDYCGPAVLASLYSFVGVRTSQRRIVTSLRVQNKIKDYGMTVKDLAKASRIIGKKNFTFWRKTRAKVSDLDTIINKYKWPVGVEWWGIFYEHEDEDSGHYGIITRIDKKTGYLRIADPFWEFAGVDRKLGIKEFAKRWWDENEIKVSGPSRKRTVVDNRVMFVITPKGEGWPKRVGMIRIS